MKLAHFPNLAQEEGISMSLERMRRAYARDAVRELIEAREKAEHDEVSRLRAARESGEAIGEARVRTAMVLGLLRQGVAMDVIETATGMTREEIEALRGSLG